jgi:hypothetical protein
MSQNETSRISSVLNPDTTHPREIKSIDASVDGYLNHPDFFEYIGNRALTGRYESVGPLVYKRDPDQIDLGVFFNANNATTNADNYQGQYPYNPNYRYYGYQGDDRYNSLFNDHSLKFMQDMISNALQGVHPQGKRIVVPIDTIRSVADSVFQTGFANADQMQKMVISFIVNSIAQEYETITKNNSLSAWVQLYDTSTGMKKMDGIKLNNKQRAYYNVMRY